MLMADCPRKPGVVCEPGPTPDGGCCEVIPEGRPIGFTVIYRNPGHWDVATKYGRAFRIRGEPGAVKVADERVDDDRPFPRGWLLFRTVGTALAWCADELMCPAQEVSDKAADAWTTGEYLAGLAEVGDRQ